MSIDYETLKKRIEEDKRRYAVKFKLDSFYERDDVMYPQFVVYEDDISLEENTSETNEYRKYFDIVPDRNDGSFTVYLHPFHFYGLATSPAKIAERAYESIAICRKILSGDLQTEYNVTDVSATLKHLCENVFGMSLEEFYENFNELCEEDDEEELE